MAGNKIGGMKARETNKRKYGENFYKNIGAEGGKKGRTGGFHVNRELAKVAGAKGGRISRRGPAKPKIVQPGVTVEAAPQKQGLLQKIKEFFT